MHLNSWERAPGFSPYLYTALAALHELASFNVLSEQVCTSAHNDIGPYLYTAARPLKWTPHIKSEQISLPAQDASGSAR